MSVVQVHVSCVSEKEAQTIGKALMRERLVACYDVLPRTASEYFWPPRSGKTESVQGSLLLCTTLPGRFAEIETIVRGLHSDDVPFIGEMSLSSVSADYADWMEKELK